MACLSLFFVGEKSTFLPCLLCPHCNVCYVYTAEIDSERQLAALQQQLRLFSLLFLPRRSRKRSSDGLHEICGVQTTVVTRPLLHSRVDGCRSHIFQAGERLRPHLLEPLPTDCAGAYLPSRERNCQGILSLYRIE